jgi:hypothetical protein
MQQLFRNAVGAILSPPVAAEHAQLSYWINSQGIVQQVAGPWDAWLGQDGEVPDRCCQAKVVGANLFSFIESDGVRHVYNTIHARILETGRPITFPFRCDSVWLTREMQMRISRDGDLLRYDSVIVSEARRPHPLPLPAPAADTLVAMCCFCKAVRFPIESPLWKDLELLFWESNLPAHFSVTHGLCGPCAAILHDGSGIP